MIYLTEPLLNYKVEEIPFYAEYEFDKENFIFKKNGRTCSIFPMEHKGLFRSIDQIIMTGHYLYGKNRDFREAYMHANGGKEYNINFKTVTEGKEIFFKSLFNLYLFGIVAYSYINNMPDVPIHYLARPIQDEPNPSLQEFLKEEMEISQKKYRRGDGTPYYNYILKKSAVMPSPGMSKPIIICPLKQNVPEIKMISSSLNEFAVDVFNRMLKIGTTEDKNFAKSFIDASWSPYLKAN